jgi:hypothetical protein
MSIVMNEKYKGRATTGICEHFHEQSETLNKGLSLFHYCWQTCIPLQLLHTLLGEHPQHQSEPLGLSTVNMSVAPIPDVLHSLPKAYLILTVSRNSPTMWR